ncbi:hypothetical protein V6248_03695 [Pseudoalteromonas agarivorans]|uniref:hypothetical protein n=1 Tax=Pseudoalteromonas agarivorans TaxID=176102 RepID=UPI00311D6C8C
MNNKLSISLAVSAVFISGCMSTGLTYPTTYHDLNKQEKYKVIHTPSLNEINTVEVGENIYSKSYLFYDNTSLVTLLTPAVGEAFGYSVDTTTSDKIIKGPLKKWSKVGQDNINSFCFTSTSICLSDPSNTNSFTHFGIGAQVASNKLDLPVKYEITESEPSIREDSFKYTALYQGKTKNNIKISFREFKNDMARPAFTQDIEYELGDTGEATIGFKGLRIQVLKATNMELSYKVLKDYN